MYLIASFKELRNIPETEELARLMGWDRTTAIIYLYRFWYWCFDCARNGEVTGIPDNELATTACGIPAEEVSRFIEAMTRSGWIEKHHATGRLFVHGWDEISAYVKSHPDMQSPSPHDKKRVKKWAKELMENEESPGLRRERKGIRSSLRWTVLARDGFTCRYCGAQAGQDGVELHIDHVLSVADGGDNRIDNLVTACQKCNGGKGARSLQSVPSSTEVIERINSRTCTLREQAEAISQAISAQQELEQQIVNLKCRAYGVESVQMQSGESALVASYCRAYGADLVLEWYSSAASHRVSEWKAIRYVCGCVRNYRQQDLQEADEHA